MIQIEPLGQIPSACDRYTGTRLTFTGNGLTLTVPDMITDRQIRWLMDRDMSLVDAYKRAGFGDFIPDPGIRPCISAALRKKYFDTNTQTWKATGGMFTCVEFHKCFVEYLKAQRVFPEAKAERRMQIAKGVYAPSAGEERCIRDKFAKQIDLLTAYTQCGAGDIIPDWPGAMDFMSRALTATPDENLYQIIKTTYRLHALAPEPPPEVPPGDLPISPPAEDKKPFPLIYVLIGAVVFLSLSR